MNSRLLFLFAFFLLFISGAFAWADSNFNFRRPIQINSTSTIDTKVILNITYDSDMLSNFSDIRFYDSDDATKLSYYIFDKVDGSWAEVLVNGTWTTTKTIYMYYGNSSAVSESNISAVSDFKDDFGDGIYTDKWDFERKDSGGNPTTTGTATETGGYMEIYSGASEYSRLISKTNFTAPAIFITKWIYRDYTSDDRRFFFMPWDGTHTVRVMDYYFYNSYWQVPYNVNKYYDTAPLKEIAVRLVNDSYTKLYLDDVLRAENSHSALPSSFPIMIEQGYTNEWTGRYDYVYAIEYKDLSYEIGSEEEIGVNITIYHPENTTYFYSNHTLNFTATDRNNNIFSVKAYLDGNVIYDNSSYVNNTIIQLTNNILSEGAHNFTVWANATGEKTKTVIFTTKYHDISTSMNTDVIEGTPQDFILDVDVYDSIFDVINATLSWNGTEYTFTNGNYFKKTLTMPLLDSIKNTTVQVYWTLWLNDSFNVWSENTTTANQTIFNLILDDCTNTSIKAYNFTIKDEQTRALMDGNVTFALYYGLDGQFNKSFENKKYIELCIYPNTTINVTGQVIYEAGDYPTRSYYLINNSADYLTDTITLSLLHSNYAYEMPFTVYDENNEDLEGAYILLERWYPETMSYQSVAMGKTDSNGKVSIPLERGGDAWYRITVIYNGRVVKVESQKQFYTSETSYTLNVVVGTANTYYNFLTNVQYDYNWTGKTLYLNVVDNSGSNPSGTLLGWNEAFFKNNLICNSTGSGNSFTLLCDASGITGPATFTGTIIYNGQKFVVLQIDRYFTETSENFGNDGLLATAILVGVSALFMIWDPVASVISAIVGLFGAHLAGFYSISNVALISMVFVGVFIVYLLGRRKNG